MRNPVRGDAITKTVCTRGILALLVFTTKIGFNRKRIVFIRFAQFTLATGMKLVITRKVCAVKCYQLAKYRSLDRTVGQK